MKSRYTHIFSGVGKNPKIRNGSLNKERDSPKFLVPKKILIPKKIPVKISNFYEDFNLRVWGSDRAENDEIDAEKRIYKFLARKNFGSKIWLKNMFGEGLINPHSHKFQERNQY